MRKRALLGGGADFARRSRERVAAGRSSSAEVGEHGAGANDAAVVALQVAVREGQAPADLLDVDGRDHGLALLDDAGEVDRQAGGHQPCRRVLRTRRRVPEGDVGERGQDPAMGEAQRVDVALVDRGASSSPLAVRRDSSRPMRSKNGLVRLCGVKRVSGSGALMWAARRG